MRKGRGLVDMKTYNDMLKIPGTKKIFLNNACNHRLNRKTGKVCVEISEDAWSEVKEMVRQFKKISKVDK